MKCRSILFIMFASLVLLSACQPTPEEDFVVDKETEDIYGGTPAVGVPSEAIHEARDWEWKHLELQDEYRGADDSVEIIIDLEGEYLDQNVPVLRASHKDLTPEYLKTMAQAVMPSEQYYDPKKLLDKETLMSWISELTERATPEYIKSSPFGYQYTDEQVTGEIARINAEIEHYNDMLNKLDNNTEKSITDWKFQTSGYYSFASGNDRSDDDTRVLEIRTLSDESGEYGSMLVYMSDSGNYKYSELEYMLANYTRPGYVTGLRDVSKDLPSTLDEDECLEMIQGRLDDIGLGYMRPVSIANGIFWFFPSYLGLDYITVETESEYTAEHMPERFYVQVSGDRIYHMKLMNATDVVMENDSLELISAEEALSALKKYMQTVYTRSKVLGEYQYNTVFMNAFNDSNVKVEISDLRFGYVRIPIPDEPTEYRLVPAWVFCGNRYVESDDHYTLLNPALDTKLRSTETLMVINAIDGSYIDHYDGYLQ